MVLCSVLISLITLLRMLRQLGMGERGGAELLFNRNGFYVMNEKRERR